MMWNLLRNFPVSAEDNATSVRTYLPIINPQNLNRIGVLDEGFQNGDSPS